MAAFQLDSMKKLVYHVHECSSFISSFVPENIQEDKSDDQTSRWSSDNNTPPQFLTLKLQKHAIVMTITFGKYAKTHVCNLKKFKVYGGLTDDDSMTELLESGLKNDSTPETFHLRHTVADHPFPCRYIKIMPLQSWGPNFNFSIWFVELTGMDDWSFVKPCMDWYNTYREREVVRLCLKHFRQLNYQEAFESLQKRTHVQLEDPLLSKLHNVLVNCGDYEATEHFIENSVTNGFFSQYIGQQEYRPMWCPMHPVDSEMQPGMRGGHQMCMDPYSETIYLFGGWDGNQDLSDLWAYHVPTRKWTLISKDTESEGGPTARSCHKVCLDPEQRQIFTLGRYLDTQFRSPDNLKSDFYVYDIESNRWTLITEDTGTMGGPQLIFDHQMCMDMERRTIYVFGGRVLTPPAGMTDDRPGCVGLVGSSEPIFSGLFSYHVPSNTWKKLCDDCSSPCSPGVPTIRSRVGHSMLFHPGCRKLFIFAGQRSKEYLNDFFTYNVDTHQVRPIKTAKKDACSIPAAGFTQRATIDPEQNEIYVLSGLSKDKEKRDDNVQNSFWVYFIPQNKWSCIYRNENTGEQYWNKMQHLEPCPRFAHQLVYDHVYKVHYLFGGNPGQACLPKLRLDDFWQLQLLRPTCAQLLQRCKMLIRKHRFKELALKNRIAALHYLQTSLSEIIDHNDPTQTKEFQLLTSVLFREQQELEEASVKSSASSDSDEVGCHQRRSQLFELLVRYFPENMTQPKANLIDLLPL